MDQLDDETNIHRDRNNTDPQPQTSGRTLLQAAWEYWNTQLGVNQSIIDRYWRGVELQTTRCNECGGQTYRFTPFVSLALQLNEASKVITLDQVIKDNYAGDHIDGFECNACVARTKNEAHRTKATISTLYPRLPPLLRVSFKCYTGPNIKIKTWVSWDFDNIDLTQLTLASQNIEHDSEIKDLGFQGTFRYQCYAVILHSGGSINSGHYISYVRDRRNRRGAVVWLRCNDTEVRPVQLKGPGSALDGDMSRGFMPYMAFFQRKWD